LAECEYLLEFSERLGYLANNEAARLYELASNVSKLLWKFKQSL